LTTSTDAISPLSIDIGRLLDHPGHRARQSQKVGGAAAVEIKVNKGIPYSITERRVPELIPVLGSQPAGDVSHKPGGRLP